MSVPITREFLREHYKSYPAPPLDADLLETNARLGAAIEHYAANVDGASPIVAQRTLQLPKRIDEMLFRTREQCEEVEHAARDERLTAFARALGARDGASAEQARGMADKLRSVATLYHEVFTTVQTYQEQNVERITREVQSKLPNDWRMRLVKNKRDKREAKMKAAFEEFVASGCTIKEKYDVLWEQQMKRREQLVKLGNASGVFKWILRTLGGVPQSMLDFVKTINDEQGPLEETRIKYSPNLATLLQLANRVHIATAIVVDRAAHVPLTGDFSMSETVTLLERAATQEKSDMQMYLAFMRTLMENSPFFLSKEDALASSVSASADTPMKDLKVSARDSVEIPVKTREANVQLVYEFTTAKHDIGFSIRHYDEDDDSYTEVLPMKRYESDKETVAGEVTLDKPGKYTVLFDNSFSIFTKKEVKYRLIVLAPSADNPETASAAGVSDAASLVSPASSSSSSAASPVSGASSSSS